MLDCDSKVKVKGNLCALKPHESFHILKSEKSSAWVIHVEGETIHIAIRGSLFLLTGNCMKRPKPVKHLSTHTDFTTLALSPHQVTVTTENGHLSKQVQFIISFL